MKRTRELKLIAVLAVMIATSCLTTTAAPTRTPEPRPTREATTQESAPTDTAQAPVEEEGDGAQETGAAAQATFVAQSVAETQAAMQEVGLQQTQAVLDAAAAPVIAELPTYGVDPSQGRLGWVHPDVTLKAEGYQSEDFANNYIQMIAKDFVMAADITWDSKYGDSGCGFVLRTDGNPDKPSQYTLLVSRIASGHAFFIAMAQGQPVNFRNYYANWLDKQFKWQNGTTNRLAVVMTGMQMRIYTNGIQQATIDLTQPPPSIPDLPTPPKNPGNNATAQQKSAYEAALAVYNSLVDMIQRYHTQAVRAYRSGNATFEQGMVGMLAYSYSGYMTCEFRNTWLWVIEGP